MTAAVPDSAPAAAPLLGEACALGAAFIWALALVLFRQSGRTIRPLHLNLFKNVVAIVLLAVTIPLAGESFAAMLRLPVRDVAILALSGVLGIAVADTLFFRALNLLGVGLVSVVDCVYTPFVFLFGWLLVGETITAWQILGALLITAGVMVSSRHAPPGDRTPLQITLGVLCGIVAMATMAFGIVYAKQVLAVTPTFTATWIRLLAGSAALFAFGLCLPDRGMLFAVFRPSPVWRACLPGAILGSYVSMTLWVAGFKYTDAAIAALLNQTTVIFSIVFAGLFLREPLTRRKLVSIALALSGVTLANLGRWLPRVNLGEWLAAL